MMNILLINPGRRDYIVSYFTQLSSKFKLKIYLVDKDEFIPSFKVSKITKNFVCPPASRSHFSQFIKNFVKKHKIKVIFPLSEHEQKKLSKNKDFFEKRGVKVIVSNYKVIETCSDKLKTYNFLRKQKINYPKITKFSNLKNNLPVIRKEIKGNSSRNQIIIKKKHDLPKKNEKKYLFQKYYNIQEYGMDIINDLCGKFLHCSVRKKLQMRAGDTDKAKLVNPKKFLELAKKISLSLKHVGNLDVDFLHNGKITYVLDLNPRFGGGYPFTHEFGYNYIERILEIVTKQKKFKKFKKFVDKQTTFSKGISIYKH